MPINFTSSNKGSFQRRAYCCLRIINFAYLSNYIAAGIKQIKIFEFNEIQYTYDGNYSTSAHENVLREERTN